MNDPSTPPEAELNLTKRALDAIAAFRFPVHLMTKSHLVLRDLDALCRINQIYAAVSFSITTDDEVGRKLEPGAPRVSDRLHAMRVLADHGIDTGTTMMPVLPFIHNTPDNLRCIVEPAHAYGASHVIPWFGMSLRDRQPVYYYGKLDELFPALRQVYERAFGDQYVCRTPNADQLTHLLKKLGEARGIATQMRLYRPATATQMSLL